MNFKQTWGFAVVAASLAVAGSAHGDTSAWMLVKRVRVLPTGTAIVEVGTDISTVCVNKRTFRVNHDFGGRDVLIRLFQGAMLAGREVRVGTSNTCVDDNDVIEWAEIR